VIDEKLIQQLNQGYVCPADAGPARRAAYEAGIDLSLIDHMLELTPAERLAEHQQVLDFLLSIKGAGLRNATE
jgi:hypothetical protein